MVLSFCASSLDLGASTEKPSITDRRPSRANCDKIWKNGIFAGAKGQDRATGDYNDFWASRDLVPLAKNIKAAVLLAHGLNDYNVMPSHSVRVFEELQANKRRLAKLGIDEEESKSALHRPAEVIQYPGRELDNRSASVLQQSVHSSMVAL